MSGSPQDRLRALSERVGPYIPRLLIDCALVVPGVAQARRAVRLPGATLVADLVGFTPLTERLAAVPDRGADEIQRLLDVWFGPLLERIDASGGQVLRSPGDAVLALWTCDDAGGLPQAVARAVHCARTVLAAIDNAPGLDDFKPRLRIGIGAGNVWAAVVGGVEDSWEFLVAGEAVRDLHQALAQADPGDIVLSRRAADVLSPGLQRRGNGGDAVHLRDIPNCPEPLDADRSAAAPLLPLASLRPFVPRSLLARLDAGQDDWLSELRSATVVFANIAGPSDEDDNALEPLDQWVAAVQRVTYRYSGSINQVLIDHKGTTVMAVWGLALQAHEDDATRAVLAALRVHEELKALGLTCSMGVATGRTFTGRRGGGTRWEYTVLGDSVNLAARLMQAGGGILCDRATHAAARSRVRFAALPALAVKGKARAIEVYRAVGEQTGDASNRARLVGREGERRLLADRLRTLEERRTGGVVFIEGEPGIGKSTLIADLLGRAQVSAVRALVGHGDALEHPTPYFAWRGILAHLLGLEDSTDPAERQLILESVRGMKGVDERAALLNPLLQSQFPETDLSRSMPAPARAGVTAELVLDLMARILDGAPTMVVFEDAQWMDSSSWALAREAHRRLGPLLLVLVTRGTTGAEPAEYRELRTLPEVQLLKLERLSLADTVDLVCRRLHVDSLPPGLVRLFEASAEGNPLFVEELAYMLRDRGLIRVEGGQCRLGIEAADLETLPLPGTVQGVLTSRIDLLPVDQQLTLKVASVLGVTFSADALAGVHPLMRTPDEIEAQLDGIAASGLLSRAHQRVQFRHAAIQEIAYQLLPLHQKRQLHRAVAEWHVAHPPPAADGFDALLAHHWLAAGAPERAIDSLERAGQRALQRNYANHEAVQFYSRLLELSNTGGVSEEVAPLVRRVRWQRALGEAQSRLSRYAEACQHIEGALSALGYPLPPPRRLLPRLAWEVILQLVKRSSGLALRRRGSAERRLEAVRALSRLGGAYYILDRRREAIIVLTRSVNLAEDLGPTTELACAYADMGNVAGMVPARALARTYGRLAESMSERLGDDACRAEILFRTSLFRLSVADWSVVERASQGMALCDQLGHQWLWTVCAAVLGEAWFLRGQMREACELSERTAARALEHGIIVPRTWAQRTHAECALCLGDPGHSLEIARSALASLEGQRYVDRRTLVQLKGLVARAWLRMGDLGRAHHEAEGASWEMNRASWSGYGGIGGYAGIIEVYVALWKQGGPSAAAAEAKARHATRILEWHGARYQPAEPRALLWRGVCDWMGGRQARALRRWRRGIRAARTMGLRYEEALGLVELGRHLDVGDAERQRALSAAAGIFHGMGASGEGVTAETPVERGPRA